MVFPVGEYSVESGRWNDGALRRRRDDAHGNDVLERFIHAHVEFDDVLLRHHQEEAGGRVRGGRHVDADVFTLEVSDHVAARLAGQEGNGPAALARILHQQHLQTLFFFLKHLDIQVLKNLFRQIEIINHANEITEMDLQNLYSEIEHFKTLAK